MSGNDARDLRREMEQGSGRNAPIRSYTSTEFTEKMSIKQLLTRLKGYDLLIGVPAEESPRDIGAEVTNAELVYLHTHGSPAQGLPPRPIIEPALAANMDMIKPKLQAAVEKFSNGDEVAGEQRLRALGMYCQNIVRGWFTDPRNQWPPLAESTKALKAKNGRSKDNPLIDTGELRKSITYVVRTPKNGRTTGGNNDEQNAD